MKVSVITTLQGPLEVEVDEDETVGTLREKIGTFGKFNGVPVMQIRIVKNGEYLDNNSMTLSSVGITEGTSIVAFISKYGISEEPFDRVEKNVLKPVVDGLNPEKSKQSKYNYRMQSSEGPLFANHSEYSRHNNDSGKNFNKSPETSELDDKKLGEDSSSIISKNVDALIKMGFEKNVAETALELCGNDISSAVEFIISNTAINGDIGAGETWYNNVKTQRHRIEQKQKTQKKVSDVNSSSTATTTTGATITSSSPAPQSPEYKPSATQNSSELMSSVDSNPTIDHPLAHTLSDTEREGILTISALTGVPTSHVCSVFFACGRNPDSCCEMLMKDVEDMGSCGQMKNVVSFGNINSLSDNNEEEDEDRVYISGIRYGSFPKDDEIQDDPFGEEEEKEEEDIFGKIDNPDYEPK